MRYVCMMLACLLMVGCQEEEKWGTMATSGFRISLQDAAVGVETKSTPEELGKPTANNFHLKIVNKLTNDTKYDDDYTSETIPVSAGTYDIIASYGKNQALALDEPYYEGTAEGEITEEAIEPVKVEIACSVENALASVVYEDEAKFKELFSSYAVRVSIESVGSADLKNGTTQSAYYRAGSKPTFTFVGTLKGNGQEVKKNLNEAYSDLGNAENFEAAKHCKLTLSLGTTEPGLSLTVKKKVEEVTINETIPMEWLPAPSVSASGFDLETKTLDVYETAAQKDASIDFAVNQIEGLEDLEFTLNFQDEAFTDLNGTYTLSGMDEAAKAKFADAGITLPTISQTSPKLQFSSEFLSTLKAKNEGNVVNTITIKKVIANGRDNKEGEQTYTINTHKPEFTVEVLPGNVWSKTFTAEEITVAEGKGDLETIKKNLVYQYQDTDGSWKDFSDQTKREQAFAEHPENLDYKVRAFYRGALASNEVDVELEDDKPVPNGDMEAWTATTRRTEWWVFGTKYADQPFFLPWTDASNQWWDTNNIETMPSEITPTSKDYKCFPTTTYKEPGFGGSSKAVVIRSLNVNNLNTSGTKNGGNTRGILYAGTTNDNGTRNEGRPWSSRPTALTFRCMYDSYDNERFGAYVELYNDETLIASGFHKSINNVDINDFTLVEVPINYTDEMKKATKICIKFCSVAVKAVANDSDEKDDNPAAETGVSVEVPEGSGTWYGVHGGSKLTLDDITLVYDK